MLDWQGFHELFRRLHSAGYTVVGPTVRDGAIVLDEVTGVADLPLGVGDDQDAGSYRLRDRGDTAVFGHTVGPQSWRRLLTPPRELLWRAERRAGEIKIEEPPAAVTQPLVAFLGVRPCDLRAIALQDLVFDSSAVPDPRYVSRRADVLIIAVNCTEPSGTCFCASMGTGPRAGTGFDLSLTELLEGDHRFVIEIGSEAGANLVASLPTRPAEPEDSDTASALVEAAGDRMRRSIDPEGLPQLLAEVLEHPHWDAIAERCLSCANCTLVCPTCFCSTVEDTTDLSGDHAERWRRWDSCFTGAFSHLHGGNVRASNRSRYRQWLTHKLGTWHDQFGMSGCVGCGRCIAWCPTGIDITEEMNTMARMAGDD